MDRLDYMLNGTGFTYDRVDHLWLVDVATGTASRLTDGPVHDREPAWSPDGTRIAFTANRRRDPDLASRDDIHVVDVATRAVHAITGGPRSMFTCPTWMPDGTTIAALGHRLEGGAGSRNDIHLFAADGSDATPTGGRNLSAPHDLMPGSSMNSDVTRGEAPVLHPTADGAWITFSAPVDGSYELWRIATRDGTLERLTTGRHYISGWDAVEVARRPDPPRLPPLVGDRDTGRVAAGRSRHGSSPHRVQCRRPRGARARRARGAPLGRGRPVHPGLVLSRRPAAGRRRRRSRS